MSEHRYDIDWIRVIAFDILIVWHVGLFFVSWESKVQWDLPLKNNVQVNWLLWPMLFVRQWRLPVLFVISGMGTRFALSSKSGLKYMKERFIRLFVPLIAGILIIIPPQVYLERLNQGLADVSFLNFYPSIFQGIYPEGNFSWGHLWFLAYLFIMSILALPVFLLLRKHGQGIFKAVGKMLKKNPLSLLLFALPLIPIEILLEKKFPLTMALTNDWYAFSFYMYCFIVGFFLANIGNSSWTAFIRIRYLTLFSGAVASVVVILMLEKGESTLWIQVLKPVNVWLWILTIFGFSAKYLNKKSDLLVYRNNAVYTIYILHFTIMLFLGYLLKDNSIYYGLKMVIMFIGTFGFSLFFYEYFIKRIAFLHPLFGIKRKTSKVV